MVILLISHYLPLLGMKGLLKVDIVIVIVMDSSCAET